MREVHKRAAAAWDLVRIWHYTYVHWSLEQADQYLDGFEAAIERLREYPFSGVSCDHLLTEARRIKVGSHHIYYLVAPDRIDIVRILDARQDARTHLGE